MEPIVVDLQSWSCIDKMFYACSSQKFLACGSFSVVIGYHNRCSVSACLSHHQSHSSSDLHFPSRESVAGKKASPISLWLTLDTAEYPRAVP
jgi:hypothetical protein